MDGAGFDAAGGEAFGDFVDVPLEAAEDDGEGGFFVAEQVQEEALLVPVVDGEVELLDHVDGQAA